MSDRPLRLVLGTADLADDNLTCRLLDEFYEAGGRAIDVGNVYGAGASERGVGRWLRTRARRDDIVLYTKGCHPPSCTPAAAAAEVETALENLGTDRLDVFLLHRDDPTIPTDAWAEPLIGELRRGTVDRVGVSNWTIERFRELRRHFASAEDRLSTFSNHFSLAEMVAPPWPGCLAIDADGARSLVGSGITVLAWASLAGGYLGGGDSANPAVASAWGTAENERRRARAVELARALGTTTAAVAIAYVLAHAGVRPVIGTRSLVHLDEALAAESIDLDPKQVEYLEEGTAQ